LLLQNAGTSFNEVALPGATGARAACWADCTGDGKPDLFLATPQGPRLYVNQGGTFVDFSAGLPHEPYHNLTAAAWLDADGDGRSDLLLANGYLGLRLYRNKGPQEAIKAPVTLGKWKYIGPFDNAGQRGFDTAYPPESELDFAKEYDGKGGRVKWQNGDFRDGEANNLALFGGDLNNDGVVYLYREIEARAPAEIPAAFGSDDTLTVWLNGEKLISENVYRPLTVDQTRTTLKLRVGKNHLLVKVCQGSGEWAFSFNATLPALTVPQLFDDVSQAWNLGPNGLLAGQKHGCLAVADVNGDGRPDVLHGDQLLINTGKGFTLGQATGLKFSSAGVCPVFIDINGDKLPDLFVPQSGTCKLFINTGQGRFVDATARAGDLARPLGHAVAAVAQDFNRDGRPDLLVACLKGPNRLLLNQGDGRFTDATETIGLQQRVFNTRSLLALDLNRDGALDIVLNNEGQDSAVLLGKPEQVASKGSSP
jgi:hypothetical protein